MSKYSPPTDFYNSPQEYMAVEWKNGSPLTRHIITRPGLGQPGGSKAIRAVESFRERHYQTVFGKGRQDLSKTGGRRFSIHPRWEYEAQRESSNKSMNRLVSTPEDPWVDPVELTPIMHHDSVGDFFESIRWDRKSGKLK